MRARKRHWRTAATGAHLHWVLALLMLFAPLLAAAKPLAATPGESPIAAAAPATAMPCHTAHTDAPVDASATQTLMDCCDGGSCQCLCAGVSSAGLSMCATPLADLRRPYITPLARPFHLLPDSPADELLRPPISFA